VPLLLLEVPLALLGRRLGLTPSAGAGITVHGALAGNGPRRRRYDSAATRGGATIGLAVALINPLTIDPGPTSVWRNYGARSPPLTIVYVTRTRALLC
jgi:hypothetical protein